MTGVSVLRQDRDSVGDARLTSTWAFFCSFLLARRNWFFVIFGAAILDRYEPMAPGLVQNAKL